MGDLKEEIASEINLDSGYKVNVIYRKHGCL